MARAACPDGASARARPSQHGVMTLLLQGRRNLHHAAALRQLPVGSGCTSYINCLRRIPHRCPSHPCRQRSSRAARGLHGHSSITFCPPTAAQLVHLWARCVCVRACEIVHAAPNLQHRLFLPPDMHCATHLLIAHRPFIRHLQASTASWATTATTASASPTTSLWASSLARQVAKRAYVCLCYFVAR